jgi:hypothetical protein
LIWIYAISAVGGPRRTPSAEPKPGPGVAHTMSLEQPFIEAKPEEPDAGAVASS